MMTKIIIALAFLIFPSISFSQGEHSIYAGQEIREIKSLSTGEIQEYLEGDGMGLAKAGELNHYPGPKHVLDLTTELNLSEEQLAETRKIYDKMHEEAITLGKLIVEKEKLLDNLFAERKIDETQLQELVAEIARLQGELRVAHLNPHLQMKQILSPQQIDRYDSLRGYRTSSEKSSKQHEH